jgi:RHS repeat-associated protein
LTFGKTNAKFTYQAYDEFGSITAGGGATRFTFTGAAYFSGPGLYQMGARFYNPTIGRFISRDTYEGDIYQPWTQNLYTYCNNNPVNFVDPTGHIPEWLKDSGEQIYKGNYTDKVTPLGTTGQVVLGIFELDFPADARDTFYDFQHWEWSWKHAGQTGLDVLGFVPVVGALKNTDEVVALVKGAGKSKIIEQHHLLPKQFKQQFKKAGLNIEDYKIPLDKADHTLKPDGLHTGTNNWNKQWSDFFEQNPNATKPEILDQLDKMQKASGLK